MGIFGPSKRELQREVSELRASIESPSVPISSPNIMAFLGMDGVSESGEHVSIDTALGVPAVWAAVNFLSGTLAGLPLQVYRRTAQGRERVTAGVAPLLHDAVNDGMSSFEWRKYFFDQVLTYGRGLTFIERAATGRPINLWPLDPQATSIKRVNGRKVYIYTEAKAGDEHQAGERTQGLHLHGVKAARSIRGVGNHRRAVHAHLRHACASLSHS